MTVLENFKNMNIDELADWLDEFCIFDIAPWQQWWDKKYCNKCESVKSYVTYLNGEHDCAYCEVNNNCRFFKELDDVPDIKQIIKMWLESEIEVKIYEKCQ